MNDEQSHRLKELNLAICGLFKTYEDVAPEEVGHSLIYHGVSFLLNEAPTYLIAMKTVHLSCKAGVDFYESLLNGDECTCCEQEGKE